MSDSQRERRPGTRSPNYPSIDLERAIERVRALYVSERQHPMPALEAVKHWGYSSLNSPGGGQLAALTRFGLLEDEGTRDDRRVRVTDLAVRILEHPDAQDREEAIRYAALLPTVHQDMWLKYGATLPSEGNLRWFLTRDRGFSDNGASDFIKEYRATIEFAKPEGGPKERGDMRDLSSEVASGLVPASSAPTQLRDAAPPVPRGESSTAAQAPPISFPLASGKRVSVVGLGDLTETDWTQFMAVLTALKPSLVATPLPQGQAGAGSND